jgi:exodeoxyribonuclease VII small subunit
MTHDKPFVFEKAFERLEAILEKMSRGDVPLDESLKLYEEADTLITQCSKKLNEAEKKVEVLIKKRSGELETDANGKPLTQDF